MINRSLIFVFTLFSAFALQAHGAGDVSPTAESLSKEYKFDIEVKMEMKQYEGEELKNTFDYDFLIPKSGSYVGIVMNVEGSGQRMQAKSVIDSKTMVMTTLMDQGGMKMGMEYDLSKALEGEQAQEIAEKEHSMKKTGNTKKILGYTSSEYEIVSGESYGLVWVTEELEIPNFYESFAQINRKQEFWDQEMPAGFLMEMTFWPEGKKSAEKFTMDVTDINKNKPSSISTDGYTLMKVN